MATTSLSKARAGRRSRDVLVASLLDHVREAFAGEHHRVDVLGLVEVEVDEGGSGLGPRGGDGGRHLFGLRRAEGRETVRLAESHEIGPEELGRVVVLVVDY